MGHTFACLPVHYVFATKGRAEWIGPTLKSRLYAYCGGIIREEQCTLIAINGMPDHVHALVLMHPSHAPSTLMRVVKSRTSGWIHDTFPELSAFAWQPGFGAFGVSKSQVSRVEQYIAAQEEHQRGRSVDQELVSLLMAHDVAYDERDIWGRDE